VPRTLASRAHVVIIGGGFAGVAVARIVRSRHPSHDHRPAQFSYVRAAPLSSSDGRTGTADVAFPIRTIFGHAKNVRFRHGRVRSVDQSRNLVVLGDGSQIDYDHLVVATGATAAFFGVPGASLFAMPLYTLSDARRLPESAALDSRRDRSARRDDGALAQLTFVVVGEDRPASRPRAR